MLKKEYLGLNSQQYLKEVLENYKAKKIFLVTGHSSYVYSGAQKIIEKLISPKYLVRFDDFNVNPQIEDLERGITVFRKNVYDLVLAIGGGSVIDMAKLIKIFAVHNFGVNEYLQRTKEFTDKGLPLVAMPTTSGSGSEATHFAVLYSGKTKYSVASPYILPDISIVDPNFTATLPPLIRASCGMDAFSQAIEAYWSVNSTDESKAYSRESILLIVESLVASINSTNVDELWKISKAAHLAGKAINISKTTAPHAISYSITSHFGVPHGHAVALTLGSVMEHNANVGISDVVDRRGAAYVRHTLQDICSFLGCANMSEARRFVEKMMSEIGLDTRLKAIGVTTKEDMDLIVKNVNIARLNNNPRLFTGRALQDLILTLQ
jgi:alcohol dehydrogenase